jgi:hypothetical protein
MHNLKLITYSIFKEKKNRTPQRNTLSGLNFLSLFFTIAALCIPILTTAQQNVGIGTTTPNTSAMLDVSSNTKGLLIPRVALTSTTSNSPIGAFVAGMMVFNTAYTADVTPGFYLCDGTKWERSGGGWSLSGNSATNQLTNFIGTFDDQDLIIKRYNVRSGLLNSSFGNTSWGVGALNPNSTGTNNTANGKNALFSNVYGSGNTAYGVNALYGNNGGENNTAMGFNALENNTNGTNNIAIGAFALNKMTLHSKNIAIGDSALYNNGLGATTANHSLRNTAIGSRTLLFNTTGFRNTALGNEAMYKNLIGYSNVAVGSNSLYSNTLGIYNTAEGDNALYSNINGSNNVAFGYEALRTNSSGDGNTAIGSLALWSNNNSSNTAIGYYAGYNNNGSGNVFIGNEAGISESGSNKLYINNDNGNANNALIYGEFNTDKLSINNKLGIGMMSQSFPLEVKGILNGNSDLIKLYNSAGEAKWHMNILPNGTLNFAETGQADYRLALGPGGEVLIGNKEATGYRLSVDGKIATTEVRVQPSAVWPDYVFMPSYNLMSLPELEKSIDNHKHLPGIPSAEEIEKEGIQVGEMQRKMMEKIEELTLYIIDLNKKIEVLQSENKAQGEQIKKMSKP